MESGVERPSERFRAACDAAAVDATDVERMWALHQTSPRRGVSEKARIDRLLADYAHWRLYRHAFAGDARASRAFDGYWTRYVRVFMRARYPKLDADDTLSGFYERLYRLVGTTFHWRCPFIVYLRAIVLNTARDQARAVGARNRREVRLEDQAPGRAEATPAVGPSPEQWVLDEERKAAVDRVLARLNPLDEQIVRECLVAGGSGRELAKRLGMTGDALYQRLRRAKLKLRKFLAEDTLLSDQVPAGRSSRRGAVPASRRIRGPAPHRRMTNEEDR